MAALINCLIHVLEVRNMVRRQKLSIVLVVAFIVFIILFSHYSSISAAQDENYVPKCKYYKVLTVHAGDNLTGIASKYYDSDEYDKFEAYISEICSINKLSDANVIKAGENIIVPYYADYH